MEKKRACIRYTNYLTIIEMIETFLVFLIGMSYLNAGTEFTSQMAEVVAHASEHDITGGYEVLGGLMGILGGIFVITIYAVFVLIILFFFVLLLICLIHGIVTLKKTSSEKLPQRIKTDAILKCILQGLFAIGIYFLAVTLPSLLVAAAGIPFLLSIFFSIKGVLS